MWRKLDTYRGEGAFLAWVTRIAVNKLRDRLRHERPWQTKTEITAVSYTHLTLPTSDLV